MSLYSWKTYAGASVLLFTWEHVGRKYGVGIRPVPGIILATNWSVWLFTTLGSFVAKVSGLVYNWIEFGEIYATARDLFLESAKLLTSPVEFLSGYANT